MSEEDLKKFKQPATLDEILEGILKPLIDGINDQVEGVYKNFNIAMQAQMNNMSKVEADLSKMVQVLWGIVNSSNARTAALERVLINNGLSQEELAAEIALVDEELKKTGEWEGLKVEDVVDKMRLNPTIKKTTQSGLA